MYNFSRLKEYIPGITATTTDSSSPDGDQEIPEPSFEPAIFPLSPFMTVFEEYDRMKHRDPLQYEALIKSNYTTKASILAHAVTNKTITRAEYSDLTFSIRVTRDASSSESFDKFTLPIVMCVDEGSRTDLKEEIARIFGESSWKLAELEVLLQDLNDPQWNQKKRFGKDTTADLQMLKNKGALGQILVY